MDDRSIMKIGGSLTVGLTKFFRKIGLKKGDKVYVKMIGRKIILSKNPVKPLKPMLLREDMWKGFIKFLVDRYGYSYIKNEENVSKVIEEALQDWIDKKKSFLEKPLIRIK